MILWEIRACLKDYKCLLFFVKKCGPLILRYLLTDFEKEGGLSMFFCFYAITPPILSFVRMIHKW